MRGLLNIFRETGKIFFFTLETFERLLKVKVIYFDETVRSIYQLGYGAIVPIFFISFPFGMMIALQALAIVREYGVTAQVSGVLSHLLVRELGPVTTGMMIAAQSGGSVAAEVSVMRIKRQIDALETFGVDPYNFVVIPRIIAITIVTPIMEIFSIFFGIAGGYLVTVYLGNISSGAFIYNLNEFTTTSDILIGVSKAFVFGLVIGGVSTYSGFSSKAGIREVGMAANNAVVRATIFFILINYIITSFVYNA